MIVHYERGTVERGTVVRTFTDERKFLWGCLWLHYVCILCSLWLLANTFTTRVGVSGKNRRMYRIASGLEIVRKLSSEVVRQSLPSKAASPTDFRSITESKLNQKQSRYRDEEFQVIKKLKKYSRKSRPAKDDSAPHDT